MDRVQGPRFTVAIDTLKPQVKCQLAMLHLALFRTTLKVLSFAKRSFAKMANFDLKLNGKNAVVQINRPKALNALNIEMIKELYAFLRTSEVLRSLIVIKGKFRYRSNFCNVTKKNLIFSYFTLWVFFFSVESNILSILKIHLKRKRNIKVLLS